MARPPTRGKRLLKLAGMTASVATKQVTSRMKRMFQDEASAEQTKRDSYTQAGDRIADTLGELKGAVMKVGQMASMAADVLPKELAKPLRKLQQEAPPMAYEVIAEQIESELGSPPERLFDYFDPEPYASASIGQVHRARTDDGREVICKVQYPGVDSAVDSDLAQLRLALTASGLAAFNRRLIKATFAELKRSLHEELDYTIEAQNLRTLAKFHERHAYACIPEVVGERSSKRILTLTCEIGEPMRAVKAWTDEERDRVGLHLMTLLISQIFELGTIHGDPNPGNFAFRRDGTVVVYDFGCVKRLEPYIPAALRDTVESTLAGDYSGVEEGLVRLGVRNVDGPAVSDSFYEKWRDILAAPLMEHDVVDFGSLNIHERVVQHIPGALKRIDSFQPAKDMIFLDRSVAGLYGNLRTMRARVPVLETLRPYLDDFDTAFLGSALPEP